TPAAPPSSTNPSQPSLATSEVFDNKGKNAASKSKDKKKGGTKRKILEVGNIITSPSHTYTVVKLLGSGGFGDVYLVEEDTSKQRYALKTEFYGTVKRLFSRLKIEAHVLEKCTNAPEAKRKFFLSLKDKGTTTDFKFMLMDVVGPSLESVKKKYCDSEFSKGTALNISIRSLKAIWDLHSLGFLHRDIKPANFSIGLGKEKETAIYVLDFGIAREFKNPNGTLRKPRDTVPFLGTPRFAARACHRQVEQAPKDDIETWIFMVYDVHDFMALPWKHDSDRAVILTKKDELMTGKKNPTKAVHKDFLQVVKYVGKLEYVDTPDYAWITSVLESIAKQGKLDISDGAVDWVGKIPAAPMTKAPDDHPSYGQTGSEEDDESAKKAPKKKKSSDNKKTGGADASKKK
ncbi:hypothetical protein PFISCL1PPCAC_9945, partial [Pristionchus fissidentatus]